jgi:hypothetical protein
VSVRDSRVSCNGGPATRFQLKFRICYPLTLHGVCVGEVRNACKIVAGKRERT